MTRKILMVEDDRDIMASARLILCRAQYEVVSAFTAEEGLTQIAGHEFDFVITDFKLGGALSGTDVVTAVRRDRPGTPVIMITGCVRDLPDWILNGPLSVRVISKPFSFLSLLDTMKIEMERGTKPESLTALDPPWPGMTALLKPIETLVHQVVNQESIVAVTDRSGVIVYVNDRFCEVSGYSRHELIGQNHRILKSGEHPLAFYKQIWATILSGRAWRGEICNRAKNGRLYYVDTMIAPLRQAGLVTHFLAVRTEITERKLAEKALADRGKHEEEERHMAALGRMANGVLHDLSNILTGVAGLAEMELGSRNGPLQDAVNRMLQMTHLLRDYTIGRPTKIVTFQLKPLLACACSLIRFRKNSPKTLKIFEGFKTSMDIEIIGNEGQIFEVVLNLLINAVEATADVAVPEIRVGLVVKEETATVTVEDNGPGVAAAIKPVLFDLYASGKGPGRGLGLSIARQIAHAHRGDLRLVPASAGKTGARFQLEIPAQIITSNRAAVDIPPPGSKRYILVSEDDAEIRKLVERTVTELGLSVIWHCAGEAIPKLAAEAREGLAAAVVDSCDLEKESDIVPSLRRMSPGLPILLISGALIDRGKRITRWGVVETLPKPFDSLEFAEALYAALANINLDVPDLSPSKSACN